VSPGRGQAHCIRISNPGLNRRGKPVSKLLDRIRIKITPAQPLRGMLVTRSGGITRCFHHGKTVVHNIVPLGNCRTAHRAIATGVGAALCRSFSITFGTTSIARSICASVLKRPSEKRRLRLASSPVGFIARNTCEASCEPVRQAEPAEQQIPCRSSSSSAADDSIPSKDKLDVFGIRSAPAPFTDAPLTDSRIPFSKRSRIERTLHFPSARY